MSERKVNGLDPVDPPILLWEGVESRRNKLRSEVSRQMRVVMVSSWVSYDDGKTFVQRRSPRVEVRVLDAGMGEIQWNLGSRGDLPDEFFVAMLKRGEPA